MCMAEQQNILEGGKDVIARVRLRGGMCLVYVITREKTVKLEGKGSFDRACEAKKSS